MFKANTDLHMFVAKTLDMICVIDQAFGQGGWILGKSFLRFYERDKVEVHKNVKKLRTGLISSHLDRTSLVNEGFITWPKDHRTKQLSFCCC